VSGGRLPSVSWLVAPEAYSEHPNHPANYGAWYVSQVIDILASHPEVFGKTALFINYDEEGGFFDHMSPPVPPLPGAGASTVSTVNEIYPAGDAKHPSGPYGLGMRVPMIVVSPWSKGGWVNSQVFDHTSVIRFIEARFAKEHPEIVETNITPWRRAVTGDLTSAFDFENAHRRPAHQLPATSMPPDLVRHPDLAVAAPATPSLPKQEAGVRPARALPYTLHADGQLDAARSTFSINMGNVGQAGAVFQVRSGNAADAPRHYTVEPQRLLSDGWKLDPATGQYDLEVRAPNGFFRAFRGSLAGGQLLVKAGYDEGRQALRLHITNAGAQAVNLQVHEAYFGQREKRLLRARESTSSYWPMERAFGWYDLRVTLEGDSRFLVQFAGHIENGRDSISDPAMSGWR
jgi:phospholipase C